MFQQFNDMVDVLHCHAFKEASNHHVTAEYGHKDGHGERDVPLTHVGNCLVCECVCNSSLFKANVNIYIST